MEENLIEKLINNLRQDRELWGDSVNFANWISQLAFNTCQLNAQIINAQLGVVKISGAPGGAVVVAGAIVAVAVGVVINYVFTQADFFGNTLEGYLNDFVDWLIFWD